MWIHWWDVQKDALADGRWLKPNSRVKLRSEHHLKPPAGYEIYQLVTKFLHKWRGEKLVKVTRTLRAVAEAEADIEYLAKSSGISLLEMWDRAVAATEELGCASVDEAVNFVSEMEARSGATTIRLREEPSTQRDPSEPHTEVPRIELADDGSIRLTVGVIGFEAGTLVEISGSATQANGAIATFYHVQGIPPPGLAAALS